MKNKFLLFSYHLLFLLTACLATTLQAAEVTLNFRHLTASEGLPSNWVGALLQDQQGMIWIGTDRGLCRYDGFEFTRPCMRPKARFGWAWTTGSIATIAAPTA